MKTRLALMFLLAVPLASRAEVVAPLPFSAPLTDARLLRSEEFWIGIYSRYYTYQALIHDARYPDKVYEVLDLSRSRNPGKEIRDAKERWRKTLLAVHVKYIRGDFDYHKLEGDERKAWDLYTDIPGTARFFEASGKKRLRYQLGQKDRFLEGLYESGRYLKDMEAVFKEEGLPVELTRLPFVESSFNVRARSKVGASGIWQFMRSTGRLFLRVDDLIDERDDPIYEARAAAKLLKINYAALGSWPLAVTAYNHGRKGMMRAVRKVGSVELGDVVGSYRARGFGFASSNFFVELLAAIEVERNAEKYFGATVRRARPMEFVQMRFPRPVSARELRRSLKIGEPELHALNPALGERILRGKKKIPKGYPVRLPRSKAQGM
jgi:membrane-bound lytic murein transglycosylase D